MNISAISIDKKPLGQIFGLLLFTLILLITGCGGGRDRAEAVA
jgi:hypothetical protein